MSRFSTKSAGRRISSTLVLCAAAALLTASSCAAPGEPDTALEPALVTERVKHDSDDPAIWIHPTDPAQSLILGTDKNEDGALYVFDLNGRVMEEKTIRGLKRPNNVDVEYGLRLDGVSTDIAVVTERLANKIRVYSLPDMAEIDLGGIEVFKGEQHRAPMGVALYRRPRDGSIFAIVSRKTGPTDGRYLWQYLLEHDGAGKVRATKVREFGVWSGQGEIEAVAVDDTLGYVYYSDESAGIRKYHADPEVPGAEVELAIFGTEGFTEDREGISIYASGEHSGYILVSDQGAGRFHIFRREGEPGNPHEHRLLKSILVRARNSDGSEVTHVSLSDRFRGGLFVAMSDDGTFHLYPWTAIAGQDLGTAADIHR